MKKVTIGFIITSLVVYVIGFTSPCFAQYNPVLGRFHQRDPLGISPRVNFSATGAPEFSLTFQPQRQYRDGMNRYDYARSNPAIRTDPLGLASTSAGSGTSQNNDQVCCKIKETINYKEVHHSFDPESPTGFYPYYFNTVTVCSQHTISNPLKKSPGAACKCHYLSQPNIKIYESDSGPCCSCSLYLEVTHREDSQQWAEGILLLEQLNHGRLVILCTDSKYNTKADVPAQTNFGKTPYTVSPTTSVDRVDHKLTEYLGTVSCKQAESFRNKYIGKDTQKIYSVVGSNCHNIARDGAREASKGCP